MPYALHGSGVGAQVLSGGRCSGEAACGAESPEGLCAGENAFDMPRRVETEWDLSGRVLICKSDKVAKPCARARDFSLAMVAGCAWRKSTWSAPTLKGMTLCSSGRCGAAAIAISVPAGSCSG